MKHRWNQRILRVRGTNQSIWLFKNPSRWFCYIEQLEVDLGRMWQPLSQCQHFGRKPPPFFIVQGKKVMSDWFDPLPKESYGGHTLTEQDWFAAYGAVQISEKGSMTRAIIPSFVKHFDKYVRNFLPSSTSSPLTLDGHKSRMGVEWVDLCQQNNCEVVQSPANTSHFLQPRDEFVNKAFQGAEGTRGTPWAVALTNTKSVQFKQMCGMSGFHRIITQANKY